jgi:hypothetical protein
LISQSNARYEWMHGRGETQAWPLCCMDGQPLAA